MKRLETERLIARPFRDSDRHAVVAILTDPLVMYRFMLGRPLVDDEVDRFIAQHFTSGIETFGFNVLRMRGSSDLVGMAGIEPCSYLETAVEFGWALAPNYWNRGFATEIGREQIRYALEDLDLPRVYALAHPENAPSNRVIEKLCLTYEQEILTDRGPRSVYCIQRT